MVKFFNLCLLVICSFLKLVKDQKYCGINEIKYSVKNPIIKQSKSVDGNYRPIKIHLDTNSLKSNLNSNRFNLTNTALNYTLKIIQKLIKVKPLHYTFAIDKNDLINWGFEEEEYDDSVTNEIDADLILLIKCHDNNDYYFSSEPKYIDEDTKRPIVGIIYFSDLVVSNTKQLNLLYFIECGFLHQITHILGFLYNTFNNFKGETNYLSKVVSVLTRDTRSGAQRSYIITPTVVGLAKKYYGCNNIIGVELEDQDGRTNSHWEARTLLGEYMNSDLYKPEQVISEFTLALLYDSGWYEVNYFTGGLMRFGMHKKCEFLDSDCTSPTIFKNEFFNNIEIIKPGCSSGRQSRAYSITTEIKEGDFNGFEYYLRFNKKGNFDISDFCLVYDSHTGESSSNYFIGSCNKGNGDYGSYIQYSDNSPKANYNFEIELGEKYGYNSFCVLSSASTIEARINNKFYKFQNNIIHPMCYPMFCSEKSLTIQINNQYIVCPRAGGKVQINGIYEGYIYCPDYNLICTGTAMCNDMFDCVEKKSLRKDEDYDYDYEIKTSQILDELIEEEAVTELAYELTDNGTCPKDCLQCYDKKVCFLCRKDFYYIGIKEDEEGPIYCMNISNISIGYYEKPQSDKSIYYPCSDYCEQCNKTHCFHCDNYHKLNENKRFCIDKVQNCAIYENETFTCIKCKGEYVFIGLDRETCHIIDKRKYYTLDNDISYYLCSLNISQCDECDNPYTCEKCLKPYYFIEDDRVTCRNDKNLSKYFTEDESISYIPCDKNFNYCDTCVGRFNCTSCINDYYLTNEQGNISCKHIDLKKYYKEGIYYYPCKDAIKNCDECDQKEKCNKCTNGYYFLEDNRTICRNDLNLSKYYTNDTGISYYPCDKYFPHCDQCLNEATCLRCNYSYGFFEQDFSKCIFVGNKKYYSLDGGITFYFCNHSLLNCDECPDKLNCSKCIDNYYFIKEDRSTCVNDKNLSKYYSEDDGVSFYPCNEEILHCDACFNNKSHCVQCERFNGYYFVGDNRTFCRNDINKTKYYTEDGGISYYPCNESVYFCDICDQREHCDLCINGYFFIGNKRNTCYNEIDFKKFYTNDSGISYYPCNTSMEHCDECFDENFCHKCYSSYILLFESPIECYEESAYINNENYFKLNDTHYKKCSSTIIHCDKCNSFDNCTKCESDYYFINENYSYCEFEDNILPKDEYFKFDQDNYFSCSYDKAVPNCQKCKNGTICERCKSDYAFIYSFYDKCVPKKDLQVGYYHNEEDTIYYPCLEHCDKCINSYECQICWNNYSLINDNTNCENCEIKIDYLDEEFNENIINIQNYINFNKNSLVLHYINDLYNYSITIFRAWECTEGLLGRDYFKINTNQLNKKLNEILSIERKNIIYVFIYKNYQSNLEIYNSENGQKLDLKTNCRECIETGFEIQNNYTYEIKNELGKVMFNKVKENNIDIFNKVDPYISNICNNFTISKIDLSIPDRIKYLYVGDYTNEVICTDKNCYLDSYQIVDFSGKCKCRVNSDVSTTNNYKSILNSENGMNSYDISFNIFKCIKSGFSNYIFSNTGFYIFLIFMILQILCFIFFICVEGKNFKTSPRKKNVSNPPKKEADNELLFIDDLNILSNNNNDKELSEKDIQDKDEGDCIEEINSSYIEYSISEKGDKNSDVTVLKDETDLNKGKRNKISMKNKPQAQNTGEVFLEKEDHDYRSKNELNLSSHRKYKKINKNGLKYKDILSMNLNNKKKKSKSKNSDIYYANTEGNEKNNKKRLKKKIYSEDEGSVRSKEKIIDVKGNLSSIKKSLISSPDNKSFREAKKDNKLSFCGFYWYLLGLKQPILNLTSEIKILNITESFIPSGIKLIKFIFILGLDLFINSLFLSQKYFSKKFTYFNGKYNLRFIDLGIDISANERFSYGFKHTILSSVYTFLICYLIQALLNYFYFNLRKRINDIIMSDNNVDEEILNYFQTVRTRYKFLFMIDIILMLLFGYYIIVFSSVFRGGDLDYLSASIWTFIFLQIFPFFVCLFLTSIRYCALKKSDENIYKFSQIFAY